MGRPNLTRHVKFQRLARLLGGEALARGSLELMWEVAYENGDPYLGSSADVETAAHWQGKRGKLTRALLDAGGAHGKAGFIERAPGGSAKRATYQVHDLEDNAPDYVLKRMQRENERRKKGQEIRDIRAAAGRKGAEARWRRDGNRPPLATGPANGDGNRPPLAMRPDGKGMPNGGTPAPAPAPAPAREEEAGAGAEPPVDASGLPPPSILESNEGTSAKGNGTPKANGTAGAEGLTSSSGTHAAVEADGGTVFKWLPINPKGSGQFCITEAMVAEWQESYPGVDVRKELKKAVQWSRDNPTKRKTRRGARAFLGRWLAREQDRGGGGPNGHRAAAASPARWWLRAPEELDAFLRERERLSPRLDRVTPVEVTTLDGNEVPGARELLERFRERASAIGSAAP